MDTGSGFEAMGGYEAAGDYQSAAGAEAFTSSSYGPDSAGDNFSETWVAYQPYFGGFAAEDAQAAADTDTTPDTTGLLDFTWQTGQESQQTWPFGTSLAVDLAPSGATEYIFQPLFGDWSGDRFAQAPSGEAQASTTPFELLSPSDSSEEEAMGDHEIEDYTLFVGLLNAIGIDVPKAADSYRSPDDDPSIGDISLAERMRKWPPDSTPYPSLYKPPIRH